MKNKDTLEVKIDNLIKKIKNLELLLVKIVEHLSCEPHFEDKKFLVEEKFSESKNNETMDFQKTDILNGIKPKVIEILILNGITDLETLSKFKESDIRGFGKIGDVSINMLKKILKKNKMSFYK